MNGTRNVTPTIIGLWVIHFAFILAVPMYAAVYAFFIWPQFGGKAAIINKDFMFAILSCAALINVIGGLTVDRWIKLNPKYNAQTEDTADGFLARAQLKSVLVGACFEAIAIFGLVGTFVGFQPWQTYLFMGGSLLALLLRIPVLRETTDTYNQMKSQE